MKDTDWAWLAGLLEGEASFHISKRQKTFHPQIKLTMSDHDIVMKAYNLLELTTSLYHQTPEMDRNGKRKKEVWTWTISKGSQLLPICEKLLPYMGERRSEQIKEQIAILKAKGL